MGGDNVELIRINEVVDTFGVSSRTLRYYEEMGLLWSSHPDHKSQRYYDAGALERLKQIVILRKLQIPVKSIATIFRSESTASLIQAFVDKLESLDTEITALSELRRLVDDFLQKMLMNGIKKISAIALLYEETEKRLATVQIDDEITFERLEKTSREALRLYDVRIIRLPPMRFLTSRLKTGQAARLNGGNMQNLFSVYGYIPNPGLRNCFYRKEPNNEWIMLMKIRVDFDNTSDYVIESFPGGLFAVASSFMEDMDDTFILLRHWVGVSDFYDYDSGEDTNAPRYEMIEEILPWDIAEKTRRYQQDVFIPIKIRQENQK
jgi:DNA-binding transcriptional MerR regulator